MLISCFLINPIGCVQTEPREGQWAQRAARKTGSGGRHGAPGRVPVQDKRNSVSEMCRFGVDPDPRIHASNSKFFSLLLFEGSFTSFFKDKKSR
jgi:hypothetical protein